MATTYTTAKDAVARSISHDERARLAAIEDIPGWEQRSSATLDELLAFGLEGSSRENDGSIDAWGALDGQEWRVRIVDALEGRH